MGNLFSIRIKKINFGVGGLLVFEGNIEDVDVLNNISTGSNTADTEIDNKVSLILDSEIELLDIPMLDNSANEEGIYLATTGIIKKWKGCSIYKSIDNESTYSFAYQNVNPSIIGTTIDKLNSGPTTYYDLKNSVTVTLLAEGKLYSESLEGLLSAKNYILIGDEILQYKNASLNSDGTYTLTTLLRGRRGTEWAIGTHRTGDRFIFLSNSLMFDRTASLNVDSFYKAVTFGNFLEDANPKQIIPKIICLKPFSVSYFTVKKDASEGLLFEWSRRSRDVTGYFKTLDLFETDELYELDITANSITVTKTINNQLSYYYSKAEQISDGLYGFSIVSTIYQLSDLVGRGYPSEVIL